MDSYLEVKIWAKYKQCFFCLLIQEMKSQRSWTYWFLCTTSRAILAQCMEEAPRRSILGRYWSFDQRRKYFLSNTIECNYSSRNTSCPLHFQSWKTKNWRNVVWKAIFIFSTTTKKFHWNTIWIGPKQQPIGNFVSVFWKSTSCWIFQTNPIQTQSNLWSNGKPVEHEKNVLFTKDCW